MREKVTSFEEDIVEKFEEFINLNYLEKLSHVLNTDEKSIVLSYTELDKFEPTICDFLLNSPSRAMDLFRHAISRISIVEDEVPKIRFTDFPEDKIVRIRDIRAKHLGKLVAIRGLIRQTSDVRPVATLATYECPSCGTQIDVVQNETTLKEPSMCSCGRKGKFKLVAKKLVDTQRIVIEESPETLSSEAQPRRLSVFLTKDLVEPHIEKKTAPGSRVEIVGIVREIPIKERGGSKTTKFDLVMDANNIERTQHEYDELDITPEDIKIIQEMSKDPEILTKLKNSIAPSIFGYSSIKESIVLQLFGGVQTARPDQTKVRGDIHILLVGDPGVAKSQLLKYVAGVSPKARYVSGKGASGAGITASVVKDEFISGWSLEAGALVLANKGICCIDEIDKMDSEDRVAMHEAMEQQCLHYDTIITLADGSEIKIGEFIETLMEKNKDKVIQGKNCLILPTKEMELEMLTTDWRNIFKTKVDRVSKHIATKKFIQLKCGNGRKIKVTPEHPVFTMENDEIKTKRADQIESGDWIPVPLSLPIDGKDQKFEVDSKEIYNKRASQHIKVPAQNGASIFKILGYLISEGSRERNRGKTIGINFTNKNPIVLNDFEKAMKKVFGLKPYKQARVDEHETRWMLRYISSELTRFIEKTFPELLEKSNKKTIPQIAMRGKKENIAEMLSCLFEGDGHASVKKNTLRIGYTTSSRRLAEQIQDLLLRFDIRSNLTEHKGIFKVGITEYKNIERFEKEIGFVTPKKNYVISRYLKTTEGIRFVKDLVPVCKTVLNLLEKHNIKKVGRYNYASIKFDHTKKSYSFSRKFLSKIVSILKEKGEESKELKFLDDLVNGNIGWEKIIDVKEIKNTNQQWTYDMTIEPNHTFVSQNMVLHNTITIAKANIHSTLRAETTILAAANPKLGRFDPYQPIASQIHMPPTLISRFDLIFPIRDLPDVSRDDKLAKHILESFKNPKELLPDIAPELMRKYIAYARRNCRPTLTQEALDCIRKFFVDLRNQKTMGDDEGLKPIPISARQLEAIVRLSQASAKIFLKNKVEITDAKMAIKLMRHYLKQVGMDDETGSFDIDRIVTGITTSTRNKIHVIGEILKNLENKYGSNIPLQDVIDEAKEKGMDETKAEEILEKMRRNGEIFEPKHGIIRRMPR